MNKTAIHSGYHALLCTIASIKYKKIFKRVEPEVLFRGIILVPKVPPIGAYIITISKYNCYL